jgi:hypothetical protein
LQYPSHDPWSDELEALLRKEWDERNDPSTWAKAKPAVRRGFEYKDKDVC